MKVGDYITCEENVINAGKVIGIVTGFDQDKDPKFTVVYSTTGYGFGANLATIKQAIKLLKMNNWRLSTSGAVPTQ